MTHTDIELLEARDDATSDDRDRDHGAIGRANAWFFDTFDRYINFVSRHHKRHAFGDIPSGTVVELGAGVGANFDFVGAADRVLAIEPNEAMHARLLERAAERSVELELFALGAERLPFADESVDTVICTLVLCTVDDPDAVLSEIRRVLRPGGTFRFVEHVAARRASPRRWIQTAISRPWAWIFEGCDLCRETGAVIDSAGFTSVDIRHHRLRTSVFVPINSSISGVAVK